jgi:regulator of sirC expression with transglutaminase-like and TPR domain
MTAKEALWLLKVQLQQNEQNQEALKLLEGIIDLPARHIDNEPRGCANYALAEEDESEHR